MAEAECTCPRIPLCGYPEGLPPNPHTIRGWSSNCLVHRHEAIDNPHLWLWAAKPISPCRCGLAEAAEQAAWFRDRPVVG